MADPVSPQDSPSAPMSGCLLQLVWSMLAPGMVLIAGALAAVKHRPIGAAPDWFLLGAVVVAIAARFLDPTKREAATPGEGHLLSPWKYAASVAGGGVLLFILAHFVAPYVL